MRRMAPSVATLRTIVLAGLLLSSPFALAQDQPIFELDSQPYLGNDAQPVDLVLVLDTSGSMDKLLDDVRFRLWDVVNELGGMQPSPALRVGLVTYGTPQGKRENGWIVKQSDLTYDLDSVYSRLMGLGATGNEEFVGWALTTAVDDMSWSDDRDALKIIFVAGNEGVDQGREHHDFRNAAADAREADIIINAIYAGRHASAVQAGWHELAALGSGQFTAVADPAAIPQIAAPQDKTLTDLNARLNATYVPVGDRGVEGLANQVEQDTNAAKMGALSSRIATKGSSLYTHASWDLIDATERPDFDWGALTDDVLPKEMRGLSVDELMTLVEEKRAEREEIRQQIRELVAERDNHLRTELGDSYRPTAGFGGAMKEAIRGQAEEKGFRREGR